MKETTGDICKHIRKFYRTFVDDPIMFWLFSLRDLPEEASFMLDPIIGGDPCHGNVKNLTDKKGGKIIKTQPLKNMMVCTDSSIVPFDSLEIG